MNALKMLVAGCFLAAPLWAADAGSEIRRNSFLGAWEGAGTNGLWCRVELNQEKGRLFTFRGDRHLSTLNFWWNLDSKKEKLIFGVNGEAKALENGQLQLMLKPVNTNIVTVRDAMLKRVRGTNQPL